MRAPEPQQWYVQWQIAEMAYAHVLAQFDDEGQDAASSRWHALELARVRAQADQARDRYFKHVL
jgi:hypothetical protein